MPLAGARKLVLVAYLAGCGPASFELEGSLSTVLDLRYKSSDVSVSDTEVAVRFLRPRGEGEDTVLKVAANLEGELLGAEHVLNLAEELANGSQRGTILRNVLDDPRTTFPKLLRGRLLFHGPPTAGRKVPGEVSVTFVEGGEFASGRTVFGSFEAKVL